MGINDKTRRPNTWLLSRSIVAAVALAFSLIVLFSASLPCRPDRTIMVGSMKMAGCSSP